MMEKMIALQQKRRSKKGGFTLVELIVVLVILAILAALLIPALTGYIDKAKQKNIIAETRQCVMAAQTLADEAYAGVEKDGAITNPSASDIQALAEVKGEVKSVTVDKGVVTALQYHPTKGADCYYYDKDYHWAAKTAKK